MAMLAEPKSKQKWSQDPRNVNWSSDKERYGYQMLEKMGWASGKGLGKEQSGNTSHVKIKKRKENLGLGAKESHANDWIAHQDDFNNLLTALNQHDGNTGTQSAGKNKKKAMLDVAKASKKRVFYKKFIRSKDTSQYSQKDMACIFGSLPSQSAPVTPLNQSDDENNSEDSVASCPTITCNTSPGFVTFKSEQNIQEYFARRMRELQGNKGIERVKQDDRGDEGILHDTRKENVRNNSGNLSSCVERDSRKLKKFKKSKIEEHYDGGNTVDQGKVVSESLENFCEGKDRVTEKVEKKRSKKNKKSKRRKIEETNGFDTLENGVDCIGKEVEQKSCAEDMSSFGKEDKIKTKKSKKKDKLKDDVSVSNEIANETNFCLEETIISGKEKVKRKKRKQRRMESEIEANGTDEIEENVVSIGKEIKRRRKSKKKE